MASIRFHFAESQEKGLSLSRVEVILRNGQRIQSFRGKAHAGLPQFGYFEWSNGVRGLAALGIVHALGANQTATLSGIIGGRGSPPASLASVISRPNSWFRGMFGETSKAGAYGQRLFRVLRSLNGSPEDIAVFFNPHSIEPGGSVVYVNEELISDQVRLRAILRAIDPGCTIHELPAETKGSGAVIIPDNDDGEDSSEDVTAALPLTGTGTRSTLPISAGFSRNAPSLVSIQLLPTVPNDLFEVFEQWRFELEAELESRIPADLRPHRVEVTASLSTLELTLSVVTHPAQTTVLPPVVLVKDISQFSLTPRLIADPIAALCCSEMSFRTTMAWRPVFLTAEYAAPRALQLPFWGTLHQTLARRVLLEIAVADPRCPAWCFSALGHMVSEFRKNFHVNDDGGRQLIALADLRGDNSHHRLGFEVANNWYLGTPLTSISAVAEHRRRFPNSVDQPQFLHWFAIALAQAGLTSLSLIVCDVCSDLPEDPRGAMLSSLLIEGVPLEQFPATVALKSPSFRTAERYVRTLYDRNRVEDACTAADRIVTELGGTLGFQLGRVYLLRRAERAAEADDLLMNTTLNLLEQVRISPTNHRYRIRYAHALALMGQDGEAQFIIADALKHASDCGPWIYFGAAEAYAALGEYTSALDTLRSAIKHGCPFHTMCGFLEHLSLEPLFADKRYLTVIDESRALSSTVVRQVLGMFQNLPQAVSLLEAAIEAGYAEAIDLLSKVRPSVAPAVERSSSRIVNMNLGTRRK